MEEGNASVRSSSFLPLEEQLAGNWDTSSYKRLTIIFVIISVKKQCLGLYREVGKRSSINYQSLFSYHHSLSLYLNDGLEKASNIEEIT